MNIKKSKEEGHQTSQMRQYFRLEYLDFAVFEHLELFRFKILLSMF